MVTEKGSKKFIPVLRQGSWDTTIPTALSGIFGVDFRQDSATEYRKLVGHLKGTPGSPPTLASNIGNQASGAPTATQAEDERYFRERRDLPDTALVKSIWQRPHWRILIQPYRYLPGQFRAPSDCEAFVRRESVVDLGYENLPIVTSGTSFVTSTSPACTRGETNYPEEPALCEVWALFQSAQFVLTRPLPTDRPTPKQLHYLQVLHFVTQAFELGRRLTIECDIRGLIFCHVSFRNVLGHEIFVPNRFPSSYCKESNVEESEEFSQSDNRDVVYERAIVLVLRLYEHFGWRDASADELCRQQGRQRL
jgi:hypothetical protein